MKRSYAIKSFPKNFRIQKVKVDGATIHVRAGGKGPAVVMLHGFGDTGDMWAPVAAVLIHNTLLSSPICVEWVCRRIRKVGTRRKRKRAISRK